MKIVLLLTFVAIAKALQGAEKERSCGGNRVRVVIVNATAATTTARSVNSGINSNNVSLRPELRLNTNSNPSKNSGKNNNDLNNNYDGGSEVEDLTKY
jgi:hypothetical protein